MAGALRGACGRCRQGLWPHACAAGIMAARCARRRRQRGAERRPARAEAGAAAAAAAVEDARAAGALGDLRAWLAAARRLEPALETPMAARIEADLVAARRADPSLRPEQLHTLLLVRRAGRPHPAPQCLCPVMPGRTAP